MDSKMVKLEELLLAEQVEMEDIIRVVVQVDQHTQVDKVDLVGLELLS
tara:strand:+ start:864 stop:1007 length:144 start_codon:yes stop_codon:yes gene_type:complete